MASFLEKFLRTTNPIGQMVSLGESVGGRLKAAGQPEYEDPAGDSPEATYARITREQYMDHEKRFQPFEDLAFDAIMDPDRRAEIEAGFVNKASEAVDNSYNRAEARTSTHRSRTGAPRRSAEDTQSDIRRRAVNKTATKVGARNQARGYLSDVEDQIIG